MSEEENDENEEAEESLDQEEFLQQFVDTEQEMEIGSDEDESMHYDDASFQDIQGEEEQVMLSRQWYKRIEVDLWKTKLHAATVGIRQKDQYRAQSRQFTTGMDVMGEIDYYAYTDEDLAKEPKNRGKPVRDDYKEVIAINDGSWNIQKEKTVIKNLAEKYKSEYDPEEWIIFLRRLVIKQFSELKRDAKKKGHAGRWQGTMEESVLMSLSQTFGVREPRPFFYVNLPAYKYRIAVFRTHTFVGDRYVFTIPNPDTGELTTYELRGVRFTPGDDFICVNAATDEKLATIDDKLINIGGKIVITFNDEKEYETLNRSRVFRRILVLFAVYIKFNNVVNDKYNRLYEALRKKEDYVKDLKRAIKKGNSKDIDEVNAKYKAMQKKCKLIRALVVTNSELTMHYNPRRVRS